MDPCPSRPTELPNLLPFKLWYLFYFAAQITQLFLPLILDHVMLLPPSSIGYLMAARRFVAFLIAPLFTCLCDRTFRHRILLVIAHVAYYTMTVVLSAFSRNAKLKLFQLSAIILIREAFVSGCEPAINNATLAILDQHQQQTSTDQTRGTYGKLRMYGSVGWGLASALAPFLANAVFDGNLLVILYVQILLGVPVVILVCFFLDLSPSVFLAQAHCKSRALSTSASSTSGVLGLRSCSWREIHYAAVVFIQGAIIGVLQTTVFLYFSHLGIGNSVLGLSVAFSCAAEGMVFFLDFAVTRSLGGTRECFIFGVVANSLVLFLFCFVQFAPNLAIAFILVESLKGATHALVLSSSLAIANEIAPPHLETTAQGLVSALLYGIGPAVGATIAGMGYDVVGAPFMYCGLAVVEILLITLPFIWRMRGHENDQREMDGTTSAQELNPLLTDHRNTVYL